MSSADCEHFLFQIKP